MELGGTRFVASDGRAGAPRTPHKERVVKMKWSRMNEAQKERQREMCRAWYHRNIEAQRERSRRRRERERLERERAGLPPKPRMNVRRFTPEELAKRKREQRRASYRRMMSDPDSYAIYAEKRHRYYEAHKDEYRERNNQWRKKHKRRTLIQRRLYNDRRRMRCRESPEFYQHCLMLARRAAYRQRIKRGLKSKYVPRMNRRTPLGCTFDRTLDTRSVFLWNNNVAASLIAGREFKAMQWREAHCDRYGQVCR